ncbi:MAG TPA: replication-relaxation family protein [Thermodesulfobacteriota bacterium]|nr:replication-relaxation family protein [Thermodesulfobacteriota bacterium]
MDDQILGPQLKQKSKEEHILTQRDTGVLLDIYKHRYLSVSQIKTLHFPSLQTAYRRLRALKALGYIKSFTVPNIPEGIYYLDRDGAQVVSGELGVEVEDLKWRQDTKSPKDYYFLRHFLKINDFRISLTLGCRGSQINLMGFIPEYYGERTEKRGIVKYIKDVVFDTKDQSRKISHIPDAVFALEKEGKAALFFLEADRGTEPLNDPEKGFLKCASFYLNYWTDGKYQRYREDFGCEPFRAFRTLIVTTSLARMQNMREAVSKFPFPSSHPKRFLWITTDEKIKPETVFNPIWHSADIEDGNIYSIS